MKTQIRVFVNKKILTLIIAGLFSAVLFAATAVNSAHAAVNDPPVGDDRSCGSCDDSGGSGSGTVVTSYFSLAADRASMFVGQSVKLDWRIKYGSQTNKCYTTGGFDNWAKGSQTSPSGKYSSNGSDSFNANKVGSYTFDYTCWRPVGQKCGEGGGKSGDWRCTTIWGWRTMSETVDVRPQPQPECSDSGDNDGDGFTDYPNDPGCTDPNDDDETDPVLPPPGPVSATISGQDCKIPIGSNGCLIGLTWNIQNMTGVPNIFNTTTNTGVHSGVAVQSTTYNYWRQRGTYTIVARDNASIIPGASDIVTASCEIGSSWNGSICVSDSSSGPSCSDGVDNDGDGLADYPNDPGCSGPNDDDETDPPVTPSPQCSDGVDNDGDGLADYPNDPGCSGPNDDDENDTGLPLTNPTITVDTPFVRQGQDVTVSWDPGGYVGCVLSANLSGYSADTADDAIVTPTGTSIYTITCGSVSDSARVDVLPAVSET